MLSNMKQDVLEAAGEESIEAVVIEGDDLSAKLLSWDQAETLLDYEYKSSYGKYEGDAIFAWTKTFVLITCEYDGATWIAKVPRNPMDIVPSKYGSG